MDKIIPIVLWVGTIFAAGVKVKYPELGAVIDGVLGGVIGVGATGLLFTKPVNK